MNENSDPAMIIQNLIPLENPSSLVLDGQVGAKVLLFGEYLVIKGARALAIPYNKFFGEFRFHQKKNENDSLTQITLWKKKLAELYCGIKDSSILKKELNFSQFAQDLANGLYFYSTIPEGHGVGSSGALTAGIIRRYGIGENLNDPFYAREIMSIIESFYHGSSSGLDPLVSYLGKSILLEGKNHHQFLDDSQQQNLNNKLQYFSLTKSFGARSSLGLIQFFLHDYATHKNFYQELIDINNQIVSNLLTDDFQREQFAPFMKRYSELQLDLFHKAIPHEVKILWRRGLESNQYYLKLCGAGGGGFFLVFHTDRFY